MGIEITSGSSKFCTEWNSNKLLYLVLDSLHKNHYFLTESCRARRLTMGMCQHWDSLPGVSQQFEFSVQVKKSGQVFILDCMFPKEWDCGIVYVLGGKTEMNPFCVFLTLVLFQFILNVILHGFDVVVGNIFNLLYFLRVFQPEILSQAVQVFDYFAGKFEKFFLFKE